MVLAGITTDVCTSFLSLALALADAGYTVFANSDASGTFDVKTARDANDRMRAAGGGRRAGSETACMRLEYGLGRVRELVFGERVVVGAGGEHDRYNP